MDAFYIKSSLLTRLHTRLVQSDDVFTALPEDKRRFVSNLLKHQEDVSYDDVLALVELLDRYHPDPDIGIEFGLALDFHAMKAGGLYARSADTFRTGISAMIRAMKVSAYGLVRELNVQGEKAWLDSYFLPSKLSEMRIARQAASAAMFRSCQLILGDEWKPQRIYFDFPAPKDIQRYRNWFRCDLSFNADRCRILFSNSLVKLTLPMKDEVLHEVMSNHMSLLEQEDQKNIVSIVHQLIDNQMRHGDCSLESIARFFPFEKRVLQRKLQQHNSSYKHIYEDVFLKRASEYLNEGFSVLEVSQSLGFASPTAFTNAFKKKTGLSPSAWKRRIKS